MKRKLSILTFIVLLISVCSPPAQLTTVVASTDMVATIATQALLTSTPTVNPTIAILEGTYTTTITEQDLTKSGIAGSEICENEGLFSLRLRGNSWSINQTAAQGCVLHGLTRSEEHTSELQ